MSNRAHIISTEFTNIHSGEKSIGVRIFDDYYAGYVNHWDDLPDDPMQLLRRCIDEASGDDAMTSLFDNIQEFEKGCYIDDSWYDWEQIKHVFDDEPDTDDSETDGDMEAESPVAGDI